MLNEVAVFLVLLLDAVLLVGVGILGAVLVVLGSGLGTLVSEVLFERLPRLVLKEVVLAQRVDDDVERLWVETCEDAVATKDEVLRAEGASAVVVGLQQRAELRQAGAARERLVGNGEEERHARVARLVADVVELHRAQVRLVLEGVGHEGHRAVRRVRVVVVVEAGVDDGISCCVAYALNISMVHEVLLRRGDNVAAAHETHLVDVRQDIFPHAFVHGVGVVRAAAAPALGRDETGGGGGCRRRADGITQCLQPSEGVCHLRCYRALKEYGAVGLLGRLE